LEKISGCVCGGNGQNKKKPNGISPWEMDWRLAMDAG
jgi:hypothetical protein